MRKVPITGYSITWSDILSGLKGLRFRNGEDRFEKGLSAFIPSKHVYLTNSGTSAFLILLLALGKISAKKEVILPAHTAACLVVAIRKAGLKPVLCDISMQDFNMNTETVRDAITSDTLCVVCVHMFGIPVGDVQGMKQSLPADVFLIEDCAQAMGSRIEGGLTGDTGDAGFFSFNKGKNLPTYGGGAIVTNADELSEKIEGIVSALSRVGVIHEFFSLIKIIALAAAFRPFIYSLLYPFILRLNINTFPDDFPVNRSFSVQDQLGTALLKRFDESCMKRNRNAMMLVNALTHEKGIMLPRIRNSMKPAFNRLPMLVKCLGRKSKIEDALKQSGIEHSNMDMKPLHHIFDLGYEKNAFPNAAYVADHLITLPVHPMMTKSDLHTVIHAVLSTR